MKGRIFLRGRRRKEGQAALIAAVFILIMFMMMVYAFMYINNAHEFYIRQALYEEQLFIMQAKEHLVVCYFESSNTIIVTNTGPNPSQVTAIVGQLGSAAVGNPSKTVVDVYQPPFFINPGATVKIPVSGQNGQKLSDVFLVTSLGDSFPSNTTDTEEC